MNLCSRLAMVVMFAAAAFGEDRTPDAGAITLVQEREAHERARAKRIAYQTSTHPAPAVVSEVIPPQHLSVEEMRQVRKALDRYFREHPGRAPNFSGQ
jgi:hypothetical protein